MTMLLGYIKNFALSKGGSTLIGVLAACTLIWFIGPRLGLVSTTARLIVIGIVLGLMVIYFIIKRMATNRKASKFASDLQASDDKAAQREAELDDIKQKMREVISSLKSSELGFKQKGNAALYALPWYMVIGPPAAGKSTMLRNSGLHFPYNRQEDLDVKGFGGTRNCDWWFSDDAILLDTAGRYTTETDDNEEWLEFLDILKKHRTQAPINGVVVSLSIVDILTQDRLELETHVNIVRERIEELIKHLGITFPVYIVFTKCDLLHGFNSFYKDSTAAEQDQVWGAYLLDKNTNQGDIAKNVADRLKELYARLCNIRPMKLSLESNHANKAEIFDFPEQFKHAVNRLNEFLNLLFKENPYQDTPKFYGFYFTSGAQEGASIQRIVGDLHQAFGFVEDAPHKEESEEQEAPKSYFIHKLFKDVIFKSQHDIDKNKSQFKIGNLLKRVWVSASILIITASVLLLSASLTTNTLLLNNGSSVVTKLEKNLESTRTTPDKVYLGLQKVFTQYTDIVTYEKSLPLHLQLGIYRADRQKKPLKKILFDSMEVSVTRRILQILEGKMSRMISSWSQFSEKQKVKYREELYQYLRTYLMLVFRDWVNVDQASPVVTKLWINEINRYIAKDSDRLRERDEREVAKIVNMYLASLKGHEFPRQLNVNANRSLVARARSKLKLTPTAVRLYERIKSLARFKYKDLDIDSLLIHNKEHVLESKQKIPGMFTAAGWKEFVHPQIKNIVVLAYKGDWVLDANLSTQLMTRKKAQRKPPAVDTRKTENLQRRIRALYFQEYASHWTRFIHSLRIREFSSLSDATAKLAALIDDEGPMYELGTLLSKNINLIDYDYKPVLTKKVSAKSLSKIDPTKPPKSQVAADKKAEQKPLVPELKRALKGLRKALISDDPKKPAVLISKYIKALGAIRDDLEKLSASANVGRDAKKYAASILTGNSNNTALYKGWVETNTRLKQLSFNARESLKQFMQTPITSSWRVILIEAKKGLESEWQEKVETIYKSTIHGRFPFALKGTDSTVRDVEEFFRPDTGVYWSFVTKELQPFLVKNGQHWTSSKWLGQGVDLSQELMQNIRLAGVITDSLFSKSKTKIGMTFLLAPIPVSGLQQNGIFVNGQAYKYTNTPLEWKKFEWPGDTNNPGARLLAVSDRSAYRMEVRRDGVWALFHLLKEARLTREQGAQYRAAWRLPSNHLTVYVAWNIRATSHNNMFNFRKFSSFRMPSSLFQSGRVGTGKKQIYTHKVVTNTKPAHKRGPQLYQHRLSPGVRKPNRHSYHRPGYRPTPPPAYNRHGYYRTTPGRRIDPTSPNFRWLDSRHRQYRDRGRHNPRGPGTSRNGTRWVIPPDTRRPAYRQPARPKYDSRYHIDTRRYAKPRVTVQMPRVPKRKKKFNLFGIFKKKPRDVKVIDGRNPGSIRW